MRIKYSIYVILFLISIVFLSTCSRLNESRRTEFTFDNKPKQINANIQFASPVTALCYQIDPKTIHITYSDLGILNKTDTMTGLPIDTLSLNFTSKKSLQFSDNCEKLLGSINVIDRFDNNYENEYIFNTRIWDTATGNVLDCIGSCDEINFTPIFYGATINSDGDEVIKYCDILYSFSGKFTSSHEVRTPDSDKPSISKIIFSPSSNKYIVSYLEGGVTINSNSLISSRNINENIDNYFYPVVSLAIDSSENYLARISNNTLSVWNVNFFNHELIIDENLDGESLLAFDQTGSILLVAGNNHIIVWDINNKSRIKEIIAEKITSIIVSPDNGDIYWGTEDGKIFIMGISNIQ